MSIVLEKKVKDWKKAEVEELAKLIENYKVVALSDLYKVKTAQIQELRKRFGDEVKFRCVKNTLARFALKKVSEKKPGVEKLEEYLKGSNLFIFTNISPFKLSILFEKNKINLPASAGDVAPEDIVVPEGNTGMSPGPVISELSDVGLPTKIESGSIWITRDTVVARKGEVISAKLASILSRLGIKPIKAGLTLKAAYEDGLIHPGEVLQINLDRYVEDFREAVSFAYNLAVNAGYPTLETLPILLSKALNEARNLAIHAMVFEKETLPIVLGKAYSEGVILAKKLGWEKST
ncbi:MAG: 50S ribosomal protein L10 [Candidatus Hecatellales archaeon ex4484_218]|nr:MAG: 50S ribosomal protein L10 [Candidatus Hecatellales archaeon ex4484_218]